MFLLTFFDGLPFFDEKTPSKRGKEAKGETARRVDTRPTRPRGQEARGCFDVVYDGCNSGVFVSWLSATVLKSSKLILWIRSNQSLTGFNRRGFALDENVGHRYALKNRLFYTFMVAGVVGHYRFVEF